MPRANISNDSNGNQRSLPVITRQVTRLHEMFWPTMDLINMAKETHRMSIEEKGNYCLTLSKDQKRLLSVLEKLLELDPELIQRVLHAPRELAGAMNRDLRKQLGEGQSNGRSEDMGKVATRIAEWDAMSWDPPLGNKPTRGMFHKQCAKLLSPITYDWSDRKVRDNFRNMRLSATPSQFPQYLWLNDGNNYNPQRPSDGLLQNEVLICAAFCMLFSPKSVKSISASTAQVSGARGSSFRRSKGKTGLSKSYNLTRVTTAFIAYVAVVVRHALTTEMIFSEICGGFNYGSYYNQIRKYLEAPRFKSRTKVLLEWWNIRLFGSYNLGNDVDDEDGAGTLTALNAEVEADPGLSGDELEGAASGAE